MKVQASGILILIACILTGCGKSMQDVAGVYETAEIKEPLNSGSYYSTTWVLDLAESGTFTLKENKSRQHMQSQKFAPVPMNGSEVSGEWKLDRDSVICSWSEYHDDGLEVSPDPGEYLEYYYRLTLGVQSNGSLVSGSIEVSGGKEVQEGEIDLRVLVHPAWTECPDIKDLRFKRVE